MPDLAHNAPAHAHSLLNWLILSGVSVELTDSLQPWQDASAQQAGILETTHQATTKPVPAARHLERFDSLSALNQHMKDKLDIGLRKTASNTVLSFGNSEQPRLMVMTDAPDASEDVSGMGYSGQGNQLIRKALEAAGFDQNDLYFTYLSKWRPPGQRSLTATELGQLTHYLDEEIRLVRPRAVLTLGESVLKAVFPAVRMKSGPITENIITGKQYLNYNLPLFPSQKGEFLVKNPTMKKSFWLGLLSFAAAIQTKGQTA